MSVHDAIFFVGNLVLCIALVPALFAVINVPRWTSLLTASVLTAFAINYLTMHFLLSAVACAISAGLWIVVLLRSRVAIKPTQSTWYDAWHEPTKRYPPWK